MKTIYKYPFAIDDEVIIKMPMNASVLSVQQQGGSIYLWALVDTEYPNIEYKFKVFGTGHEIDFQIGDMVYVSTIQIGAFVGHIFQV